MYIDVCLNSHYTEYLGLLRYNLREKSRKLCKVILGVY